MLKPALVSLLLAGATALAAAPQAESTRRQAERLEAITRAADPMRNLFLRSADKIPILRAQLDAATGVPAQLPLKIALAQQLLQAGDPRGALQENESVERLMAANQLPTDEVLPELLMARALCYLRIGEQDNCLGGHNADSCLFPIRGEGVYQRPEGARGAVQVLAELLAKHPGDLRARWLLNLSYMTLGEYPAKVPPAWLIPPALFASDYDIKHFPDVAPALGLDVNDLSGGVVVEDFDGDGQLDLMVSAMNYHSQLRYFHNNGDGTFTDRTTEAGLTGETGGLNLVHCDYNNDGFADVIVLRGGWLRMEGHYPLSLLRNNGDGTFTDATEESGLLRHLAPSQTAALFDYNGDGWIDLFIANESEGNDRNPCELFRNNRDGTFTDVAADCGVAFTGFFKGVTSGDYNNDGRPDLLLSRIDGPKLLLRNDGAAGRAWKFTDVAPAAGITGPPISFPCWFWDYDNDGNLDVMILGYAIQDVGDVAADYLGRPNAGQKSRLFHNNGDGTFTDVSHAAGVDRTFLAMGANFGDLDNDGWLDFYAGTGNPDLGVLVPNRMFRNDGAGHFQDVTTAGGFGQLQKGHGIAFGDINNDGAQDIYSVIGGAVEADHYHNQLFANPGHGNHWLKLALEGVQTNRAAIGARVKVVVPAAGGERAIYRTVGGNASFGCSPFRLEIGLGAATAVTRVEIFWPVTGKTQVLTGLAADQAYRVREDAADATPLAVKRFAWPVLPAPAFVPGETVVATPRPPPAPAAPQPPEVARYLDTVCRRQGLQLAPSGLAYHVQPGRGGERPGPADTVIVTLRALAADGATPLPGLSLDHGSVDLAATFPGLREGLQMMTQDSQAVFVLPPSLSFGDGAWPEGATRQPLVFRVTLHRVVR
jgi:hypothetical protein